MARGEKDASDRCRRCQAQARRERVYGLGYARTRSRGSCPPVGASRLRLSMQGGRSREARHAGAGGAEDRCRGAPGMPGDRGHEEIRRQGRERARQDADLRRLRRRSVEIGLPRSIQAGDAKKRARLAENPAAAGLRRPAARPHRPLARPPLVRRIQPHRTGRRQPRARHLPPDHEPRHRPRPCRDEPHP